MTALIERRMQPRAARRDTSLLQRLTAVALVLASVALLLSQEWSRRVEAMIAEWSIHAVLGLNAQLSETGTTLTVGAGSHTIFSLNVTFACSVVLLLIPFMLTGAALLGTGRATLMRTLPAVVVGAIALLAINAARMVVIARMTHADGLDGFGWSHTVYGSLLVLAGLALTLVAFVRTVSEQHHARKGRRT